MHLSHHIRENLLAIVQSIHGDLNDLRHAIHSETPDRLTHVAETLDTAYHSVCDRIIRDQFENHSNLLDACHQPLFQRRVINSTLEVVHSEPLSPPLTIIPDGASFADMRPRIDTQRPVYTIIFEQFPHVTNEFYPLSVDAYVYDLEHFSRERIQVVAVHESWINEDLSFSRAIFFSPADEQIIESSLVVPCIPTLVHFLCITPKIHRRLSTRVEKTSLPMVNPYMASTLADDKYRCYQAWKKIDVPTPKAILIQQNGTDVKESLQQAFGSLLAKEDETITIILQPNTGTEGRGVAAFSGPISWDTFIDLHPDFVSHALECLKSDDLLVRRGVGKMLLHDDIERHFCYFDSRLNVIQGRVESGFYQVAPQKELVTSPSQGGRIIEWNHMNHLRFQANGNECPFVLGDSNWGKIVRTVELAATILPNCEMVGIDVRLDWVIESGEVIPWILDINPRPAGLSHSRSDRTQEPSVTQTLWKLLK